MKTLGRSTYRQLLALMAVSLTVVVALVVGAPGKQGDPPQAPPLTDACELGKFDTATRSLLEASDSKAMSKRLGFNLTGESVVVSIILRQQYGDFVTRYLGGMQVGNGPYTYPSGPTVIAAVPVTKLCDLSLQPEVVKVEEPEGVPF